MAEEQTKTEAETTKTVDWDTYQRVVTAKQNLEAQVGTLKGEVATLTEKSATVDTLAGQVEEWRGKAQEAESRFGRFREISSGLGTTDEDAIAAAEWQYGRLPAEGRPTLPDWLSGLKEKPDEAPKVLQPWLTPPEQPTPGPDGTKGPKAQPRPPKANRQPPGAPAELSDAEIKSIREEAVKTGDWSRWKEHRKTFVGG